MVVLTIPISPSRYEQYEYNAHEGQVFHGATQGRKREAPEGGRASKGKTCQRVFNLSNRELTNEEKTILDKGLKFALPKEVDKFNTFIEIHNTSGKSISNDI